VFRKTTDGGGNRGRRGFGKLPGLGVVAIALVALLLGLAAQADAQLVLGPPGAIQGDRPALAASQPRNDPGMVGQAYQLKPITAVAADIRPRKGKLPEDHSGATFSTGAEMAGIPDEGFESWKPFLWEAPATSHRPLYFENVNLERHGYSFGVAQPFVSASHFACSTVILPYRMVAEPPCQPIYTLGHVRPGTPTPFRVYWPPLSLPAGVAEGALIVGLICLIP
jgi:hypothetical protein